MTTLHTPLGTTLDMPLGTSLREASRMPEGLEIEVRNRHFDLASKLGTDWLDNDPFKTAFFNSMSISFPIGEKSFIDSVKAFDNAITDSKLKAEMKSFYGQESVHRREHQNFNEMLCAERGYNLEKLELPYVKRVALGKKRASAKMILASTAGAEHLTAIMAAKLLQGWLLGNADTQIKELWLWHATEELEHKSVAYDVYTQVGGRFKMRKTMMRLTTFYFLFDALSNALRMLSHDKQLWKWRTLKSGCQFLLGKEGIIRSLWPEYKTYFKEDFHPWNNDNRELLENWEHLLEPS